MTDQYELDGAAAELLDYCDDGIATAFKALLRVEHARTVQAMQGPGLDYDDVKLDLTGVIEQTCEHLTIEKVRRIIDALEKQWTEEMKNTPLWEPEQ